MGKVIKGANTVRSTSNSMANRGSLTYAGAKLQRLIAELADKFNDATSLDNPQGKFFYTGDNDNDRWIDENNAEKEVLNEKLKENVAVAITPSENLEMMCGKSKASDILQFLFENTKDGDNPFSVRDFEMVFDTFKTMVPTPNANEFKQLAVIVADQGYTKEDGFYYEPILDETCERFSAGELEEAFFRHGPEDVFLKITPSPYDKILKKTAEKADLPVLTQLLVDLRVDTKFSNSSRQQYQNKVASVGAVKMKSASNKDCTEFIVELDRAKLTTTYSGPVKEFIKKAITEKDMEALSALDNVVNKFVAQADKAKSEKARIEREAIEAQAPQRSLYRGGKDGR